jgi:hypothetical protein
MRCLYGLISSNSERPACLFVIYLDNVERVGSVEEVSCEFRGCIGRLAGAITLLEVRVDTYYIRVAMLVRPDC